MNIHDVKTVYYHSSCPDGTAAAVMVAKAADMSNADLTAADFVAIQYGSPDMSSVQPGPGQLWVDITPPKERWREWEGTGVMVLDHHETAREVTEGLGGVYGENDQWSGAKLAYHHVYAENCGPSPVLGAVAELAMIRDTWKKDHPDWREAGALAEASTLFGAKELISRSLSGKLDVDEILAVGRTLMKSIDGKVKKYSRGASHSVLSDVLESDVRVSVFNCTEKLISEVGNDLVEGGTDVAIGWFFSSDADGQFYSVSLRTGGRISARKVVELYGGGGHDRAAGFRVKNAGGVSPDMIVSQVMNGIQRVASTLEC